MPVRSSVTVSLVPEARGGPFVFWDDLAAACDRASRLGFDGIEVFPRDPDAPLAAGLARLLPDHGLALAAMGTGAGWVVHRLTLSDPDAEVRRRAVAFVRRVIDVAGPLGAPAIIGSMQGRSGPGNPRSDALARLAESLDALADHAATQHGVPLLVEPLNRYETDLANTLADGLDLLGRASTGNLRLLADLFHMNIEEADPAGALRGAGPLVGHVHFADSNRCAVGLGHLDLGPIAHALGDLGYAGFASAEVLPRPDPETAAARTIASFRRHFRPEV